MSILVDESTRVVVQGITGREGAFHTHQMIEYGTNVVGGVTPGKGETSIEGLPVFDTVYEAIERTKATASIIYVPASFAMDAILEAADAGIELIVCITEGIPALDMAKVMGYIERHTCRLIGPNCPGVISPEKCKIGIMPGYIHKPGSVGVISRSGTLTYEAVYQLTSQGIGQSTCIGIGGDSIIGTRFAELLEMFEADEETEAVLMIGEIGGSAEEEAAEFIEKGMKKPVAAFIAGRSAPPEKRMGHAGAIISGGTGTAREKIESLKSAGVTIVESPALIGESVKDMLEKGN